MNVDLIKIEKISTLKELSLVVALYKKILYIRKVIYQGKMIL